MPQIPSSFRVHYTQAYIQISQTRKIRQKENYTHIHKLNLNASVHTFMYSYIQKHTDEDKDRISTFKMRGMVEFMYTRCY